MGGPPRGPGAVDVAANFAGGICGGALGLGLGTTTFLGGLQMKNLRNYGLAMAGSITALVPCPICCPVGVPFGIWSLVVMNDPVVKGAFR
jgi:hypothetical protein